MNDRALVLGAGGFIGTCVARALADHGTPATLVVRDRSTHSGRTPLSEVVEQDLADREGLHRLVREVRPTVIFNLAGYAVRPGQDDPEQTVLINEHLVEWLVEAMHAAADRGPAPRLIHAGSAAEYGGKLEFIDETTRERPQSLYGRTKLAATRTVVSAANHGLPATSARLFNVYGPGEPAGRLVSSLLDAARSGAPLRLSTGAQRRDFIYVEDVAEALVRIGDMPAARPIVNVATGRSMSVRDFALTAARVFGVDPAQLVFGDEQIDTGIDYGTVDVSMLRLLTSWSAPTSVEEGLRKTAGAAGMLAGA